MELIDMIKQETHGGSMRYVIGRKNKFKISKNVNKILDEEKRNNLDNIESCINFKKNCENSKLKLVQLLKKNISEEKELLDMERHQKVQQY